MSLNLQLTKAYPICSMHCCNRIQTSIAVATQQLWNNGVFGNWAYSILWRNHWKLSSFGYTYFWEFMQKNFLNKSNDVLTRSFKWHVARQCQNITKKYAWPNGFAFEIWTKRWKNCEFLDSVKNLFCISEKTYGFEKFGSLITKSILLKVVKIAM